MDGGRGISELPVSYRLHTLMLLMLTHRGSNEAVKCADSQQVAPLDCVCMCVCGVCVCVCVSYTVKLQLYSGFLLFRTV